MTPVSMTKNILNLLLLDLTTLRDGNISKYLHQEQDVVFELAHRKDLIPNVLVIGYFIVRLNRVSILNLKISEQT